MPDYKIIQGYVKTKSHKHEVGEEITLPKTRAQRLISKGILEVVPKKENVDA
jgi:hypothetical protein